MPTLTPAVYDAGRARHTEYRADGERALRDREGKRITDIVLGRADNRTHACHYLVVERLGHPFVDVREIEQYRDVERVHANARDCETGNRHAKCLGAFTITYRDGKVASVDMIDLTAEPAIKVGPRKSRNLLLECK